MHLAAVPFIVGFVLGLVCYELAVLAELGPRRGLADHGLALAIGLVAGIACDMLFYPAIALMGLA